MWAISFPFNSAPDEASRYLIPQYIFENHSLPTANTVETIIPWWGFSYAAYPYLMSIISSFFMMIASIFSTADNVMFIAARMSSVLVATINVYFAIKLSKHLFKNTITRVTCVIFICLLPQVVYLSSYHNNDILGLCTTTAIIYYWFEGIKTQWSIRTCIPFAIGMGICLLSYYNAYGVLLASVFVYFGSIYIKRNEWKLSLIDIVKRTAILGGIIILIAGWWFIFAYINNNGDFLGLTFTKEQSELLAIKEFKPSLKEYPLSQGLSLIEMLFSEGWLSTCFISIIGVFGYFTIYLRNIVYIIMALFIIVAVGGCILYVIKNKKEIFTKMNILLMLSLGLVLVVPVILSVYRSYTFDFQAQGRYIITIIPVVAMIMSLGFSTIDKYIVKPKLLKKINLQIVFNVFMCFITIYSYIRIFKEFY